MKSMDDYTIEELEEAIERKKVITKREEKPEPLEIIDFTDLIKLSNDHLNNIEKEGYAYDDTAHFFYETILETIFGIKVWDWIHKNTN